MSFDLTLVLVLAIIFIASLTRSIFGFADALIAMPLLSFVVDLDVARPLIALISVLIALVVIAREWRSIHFADVWRLIVAAIFGIPLGAYALTLIPDKIAMILLGLLVVSFASYNLLKPRLFELKGERLAWLFGFVAGAIGCAYNTPGPIIVIYGTLRRWPPQRFRASMQGYLLPTAALIALGHGLQGLWTSTVLSYFAASLPVVVLAIVLGRLLSRRFQASNFNRAIYILLILIGAMLLVRSLWGSS